MNFPVNFPGAPNPFGGNQPQNNNPSQAMSSLMSQQQQQQNKKKPWWTSLIGEAGGILGSIGGGALAGGLAGGAAGAETGPGALLTGLLGAGAGGAAGAFMGDTAEQKIRDNTINWGKSAKDAAITGLLSAGPLKLIKGGAAASGALAGGGDVGSAFSGAIDNSLFAKAGDKLASNVLNPLTAFTKSQVGPFTADAAKRIQQTAQDLLPTGSAVKKFQALPGVMGNLIDQQGQLLKSSTVVQTPAEIAGQIKQHLDGLGIPDYHKIADPILTRLNGLVDNNGQINAVALNSFRKDLNGELSRAYGAVAKGNPLATADEVRMGIKEGIDKVLPDFVHPSNLQAYKAVNGQMSDLNTMSRALFGQSQKGIGLPFVKGTGFKTPFQAVQGVEDLGSKFLQGAHNLNQGITGMGARAAGAGLLNSVNNPNTPQPSSPDMSGQLNGGNFQQGGTDPNSLLGAGAGTSPGFTNSFDSKLNPGQDVTQNLLGGGSSQQGGITVQSLQNALIQDQQATGGKNASFLMQIAQLNGLGPKGQTQQLSTAQQARHDALASGLASLNSAGQNLDASGGAKGVSGELGKIPWLGKYIDPKGASYTNTKIEMATALAKAVTGGSRPAQQVIDRYMHSLPDINDPPGYASAKLNKLRMELMTQAQQFGYNDLVGNSGAGYSYGQDSASPVQDLLSQLNGQ